MTGNMEFNHKKAHDLIAQAGSQEFMPESESKEMLLAYGLPVIRTEIADSEARASDIGREIGYPLAMKIHSPDITHKTDAGGVCLDLRCDEDVRKAYNQIISSAHAYKPDARVNGVTIQPYFSNPDFEILMGAKRDVNFGPVILFGMGGIYTEILKRPLPGTSPNEPPACQAAYAADQSLYTSPGIPKPPGCGHGAA